MWYHLKHLIRNIYSKRSIFQSLNCITPKTFKKGITYQTVTFAYVFVNENVFAIHQWIKMNLVSIYNLNSFV